LTRTLTPAKMLNAAILPISEFNIFLLVSKMATLYIGIDMIPVNVSFG